MWRHSHCLKISSPDEFRAMQEIRRDSLGSHMRLFCFPFRKKRRLSHYTVFKKKFLPSFNEAAAGFQIERHPVLSLPSILRRVMKGAGLQQTCCCTVTAQ